ncbi:MAG: hypothetical protein KDK78_04495, partial [Chlamydiia bacterium]|nr:hypothetical protein [Chlamydiia bacterium]
MRVDPPLSPVLPDIADPIDGVDELGGGPNEGEELPVEQSLEQRIGALAKRIHAAAQCPDGDRLIGELEASVLSFLQSPKKDAWAQRLSVLGKILCMGGEDLQELLKLPEYEGLTTEQKVVLVEGELDQLVDLATVRELDLSNEGLTELPA